ncbi:uncharacterized protein [Emydura macquarii macquarii]|uniref:uncharacterized protein n=1 Tax=Emydura macquarii macquarii TaxID=1129001 RepID=UPI00352A267B
MHHLSLLQCQQVQAISSVISTTILNGTARSCFSMKREMITKDIVLLPFNSSNHWVIGIALMAKKELLIIDPLCQETKYVEEWLKNWRAFLFRDRSKGTIGWKTKVLEHKAQSDGHNCGPLILRFAESYLLEEDIRTVETTEEAMNIFRRKIAIRLLQESDSVEDYCIYCSFMTCTQKKDCMMVQCDSCKRWAHVLCIPGGISEDILHDEHKEYKCKKCA